jgi:hypothetical protein
MIADMRQAARDDRNLIAKGTKQIRLEKNLLISSRIMRATSR